jgi:hypothetical protein
MTEIKKKDIQSTILTEDQKRSELTKSLGIIKDEEEAYFKKKGKRLGESLDEEIEWLKKRSRAAGTSA